MPLHLDKEEIDDAKKTKLDQLIGIDDLSLLSSRKEFLADEHDLLANMLGAESFCSNAKAQKAV